MKNLKWNWILKFTICLWAIILVAIFVSKTSAEDVIQNQPKEIEIENETVMVESLYPVDIVEVEEANANADTTNEIENEIEIVVPYYVLTDYERFVAESIVAGEAGDRNFEGKLAIASCLINAALKDNITVSEVRSQYGYDGWKDIDKFESECLRAYGNTKLSDEVRQAVAQVFDEGKILNENILYFYNPNIMYSSFHENHTQYYFTIDEIKYFGPKA